MLLDDNYSLPDRATSAHVNSKCYWSAKNGVIAGSIHWWVNNGKPSITITTEKDCISNNKVKKNPTTCVLSLGTVPLQEWGQSTKREMDNRGENGGWGRKNIQHQLTCSQFWGQWVPYRKTQFSIQFFRVKLPWTTLDQEFPVSRNTTKSKKGNGSVQRKLCPIARG